MSKYIAKALIVQGGGPTVVINQSLVGVIEELKKYTEIERIYGGRHGISGVVKDDLLDLTDVSIDDLELIAGTPSSALGSSRDKPDQEYCHKMFKVMAKHNIGYFFFIGGNDGAIVCNIINQEAKKVNYQLRVIHVPKTIDNDLLLTDHCPGFGSAGKFIAQAFVGADLDNRSLPGVYIGVVMGRHAGFLTASSVLAKQAVEDGPHLIYLPEKPFFTEQFIVDVENVYNKYGRCVVAVSEGIQDSAGNLIVVDLMKNRECDPHGNVQLSGNGALGDLLADLIRTKTKIKRVRADTLGYLQRSFLGCVSETDKVDARIVGTKAVQFVMAGDVDGSVIIKRTGNYEVDYELAPLTEMAKGTKSMPNEFIEGNNMVSQKFIDYIKPLVGTLPLFGKLEAPAVKKV